MVQEFASLGHQVTVVTETPAATPEGQEAYAIERQPGVAKLIKLALDADVCLMIGASLRAAPALLLAQCPVVVSHHIYLQKWSPAGSAPGLVARTKQGLKRLACTLGPNLYTSHGFRDAAGGSGEIIRNPFDIDRFRDAAQDEAKDKDRDIVFVGRMIPEKGCIDLIDAVSLLDTAGMQVSVTLIGEGTERALLERKVYERGLDGMIRFAGQMTGADLARMLSRHRLMVVPSRWPEPFGIVALEGMASGCVVIGTELGGLPEAIGPGGVVVPPANPKAIADAVRALLADDDLCRRYRHAGAGFAALHAPRDVARDYIEVLGRAVRGRRSGGEPHSRVVRRLPPDGKHSSRSG
ncbi:glycosyltransferase family 4 protein [Iodidimonas sp. SYSU 1G8]|uniref:glycosyltransferase family 4 protein n=1 Tax=Iodidimonas sp. SYSU 1G8 TaxID=3133967 RepID=UPI0031FEE549